MRINRACAPKHSALQKACRLSSTDLGRSFFFRNILFHILISLLLVGTQSACQRKEAKTTSTETKEAVPAMRHGINLHN